MKTLMEVVREAIALSDGKRLSTEQRTVIVDHLHLTVALLIGLGGRGISKTSESDVAGMMVSNLCRIADEVILGKPSVSGEKPSDWAYKLRSAVEKASESRTWGRKLDGLSVLREIGKIAVDPKDAAQAASGEIKISDIPDSLDDIFGKGGLL